MNLLSTKRKFQFQILGTSFDTEVVEVTLEERLSAPYRANLVLACEENIPLADALGKEALLKFRRSLGGRNATPPLPSGRGLLSSASRRRA